MPDNKSDRTAAIVGAGVAGLSCARLLADSGVRVTIFEKSSGPGGRMSTRRFEATPDKQMQWQCDHGAQYFTARSPAFVDQVKRWEDAGVVASWQPELRTIGRRPDTPAAASRINHRYVGTPRMTSPARHLATGLNLISGARVVAIRHSDQGWFLIQENTPAPAGPFRDLVLAIPAQQAADLLGLLTLNSDPCAPATQALTACRKHALRPCWALMLNFRHPQSAGDRPDTGFDAVFVNPATDQNHIVSWIARDNSKPGRLPNQGETWVLHASPEWSQQHLESDPPLVFDTLLSEFRALTGIQADVSAHSLHRWRFAQTANTDDSPGDLWLHDIRLGLCGDWLNGGRVEGAWLSGYQLAQRMLAADRKE
ncbi:MAG: FAD-dependent oxidoreductase [Pseudohongiella sp.]|nr:FAD-dependent oxidoreductase [Pseudohongiella sp.]